MKIGPRAKKKMEKQGVVRQGRECLPANPSISKMLTDFYGRVHLLIENLSLSAKISGMLVT